MWGTELCLALTRGTFLWPRDAEPGEAEGEEPGKLDLENIFCGNSVPFNLVVFCTRVSIFCIAWGDSTPNLAPGNFLCSLLPADWEECVERVGEGGRRIAPRFAAKIQDLKIVKNSMKVPYFEPADRCHSWVCPVPFHCRSPDAPPNRPSPSEPSKPAHRSEFEDKFTAESQSKYLFPRLVRFGALPHSGYIAAFESVHMQKCICDASSTLK